MMIDTPIKEIAEEVAREQGIELDSVAICRRLRKLAKLDRVSLRTDAHSSGYARNLISYLEYCGLDAEQYVKEYLSNIQPYMIERVQSQETSDTFRCIIDKMYAVSLYVKVDTKQYDEVIVSFHESYGRGGVAKKNYLRPQGNDFVPVFAESVGSINSSTGDFSVNVLIQRGLLTLPLSLMAIKCKDYFLVRERDITTAILGYCNQYIEDLYASNLNLDFSQIEVFTMLQQLSFTSYGRDTFSSISLLVDSLSTQRDVYSKKAADFALVTFVQNLSLTDAQIQELIDLLHEKYAVSNIKAMQTILARIESSFSAPVLSQQATVQNVLPNQNPIGSPENGVDTR